MHLLAATNETDGLVSDNEVKAWLPALQHQANYDFRQYWDTRMVTIQFFAVTAVPAGWSVLHFLKDSDQAGALGYHDFTAAGLPELKVFVGTDQQYGLSPTVTASHEILEAIADPDISRGYQTSNTRWYGLEVGDPVEADELGYPGLNGVTVSDFALPAWFRPWATAARYDYKGHTSKPLQLTPGGYASYYEGGAWHQVQAQKDGSLQEVAPDPNDARLRDRNANPLLQAA